MITTYTEWNLKYLALKSMTFFNKQASHARFINRQDQMHVAFILMVSHWGFIHRLYKEYNLVNRKIIVC